MTSRTTRLCFFFFYCSGDHRDLHSFPTRRSSDLSGADVSDQGIGAAHLRRPGQRLLHQQDRKSTRLNSSHVSISYAVFCLKKKISDYRAQINSASRCKPKNTKTPASSTHTDARSI